MKVGIIGLGNLGSAVAYLVGSNGHDVLGWEYDAAVVDEINLQHTNQRYLQAKSLPVNVQATGSVDAVFAAADLVFVTLPSRFIQPVLAVCAAQVRAEVGVVNMSKGLNPESGQTAYQMLAQLFPNNPTAMLAGPSLANEFVRGVLTGIVAASESATLIGQVGSVLNNARFAVASSDDVLGVELGGVLKNIYALGLGVFDGREDRGLNFIGAYLTQALLEMRRLGVAMGAKAESFDQLCGVGDLIATAMSPESHNVSMGRLVAQGLPLAEIEQKVGVLPEGYNSLQVALRLAETYRIKLPLAALLQQLIEREITIDTFLARFARVLTDA